MDESKSYRRSYELRTSGGRGDVRVIPPPHAALIAVLDAPIEGHGTRLT